VATAIVWGIAFSTVLTLPLIPLLYRLVMGRSRVLREATAQNTCGARVPLRAQEPEGR